LSKGEAGTRGGGENESCSSQSYEASAREHSTFLQSWRQDHDYLPTAVNISNSQIAQVIENLNRAGRSGGRSALVSRRTQILNDISPLARWATQTVSRSTRHCHLPVSDGRPVRLNVRFGSLADIRERNRDVRFAPKSRDTYPRGQCLLSANSGSAKV